MPACLQDSAVPPTCTHAARKQAVANDKPHFRQTPHPLSTPYLGVQCMENRFALLAIGEEAVFWALFFRP